MFELRLRADSGKPAPMSMLRRKQRFLKRFGCYQRISAISVF
jgi:hypothetical protein